MSRSQYYKLALGDGLEALEVRDHHTSFPFHFHPTFNISLVYDGNFQTKLNDRTVNAQPGSILITNPQEIHANPRDKGSNVSFFTFYFSPGFLTYCNNGRPVSFVNKVIDDAALSEDMHQLKRSLNNQADPGLETGLARFLARLAQRHGSDKDESAATQHPLFEDFLAEDNFEKFSLAEAARRFGIDKYKFLRLFKFQTGLTPSNYFILRRIEQSKIMLRAGQDLLSIAIELGFYDTAHFCHHFKKFTGISPMAYTGGVFCCNILQ
jgi:AraC-like DNA-binding protein